MPRRAERPRPSRAKAWCPTRASCCVVPLRTRSRLVRLRRRRRQMRSPIPCSNDRCVHQIACDRRRKPEHTSRHTGHIRVKSNSTRFARFGRLVGPLERRRCANAGSRVVAQPRTVASGGGRREMCTGFDSPSTTGRRRVVHESCENANDMPDGELPTLLLLLTTRGTIPTR